MAVPFIELLSDRFRQDIHGRILVVTLVIIVATAVYLEILDDVVSFDELGDVTIFLAAVLAWYGLRLAATSRPQPIELGILIIIHLGLAAGQQ